VEPDADAGAVQSEVEVGDVTEADEPLGTRAKGVPGKVVEDAHRPVTASRADDGLDLRIGHGGGELSTAARVVTRGVAGAFEDAARKPQAIAGAKPGEAAEQLVAVERARRRADADERSGTK